MKKRRNPIANLTPQQIEAMAREILPVLITKIILEQKTAIRVRFDGHVTPDVIEVALRHMSIEIWNQDRRLASVRIATLESIV